MQISTTRNMATFKLLLLYTVILSPYIYTTTGQYTVQNTASKKINNTVLNDIDNSNNISDSVLVLPYLSSDNDTRTTIADFLEHHIHEYCFRGSKKCQLSQEKYRRLHQQQHQQKPHQQHEQPEQDNWPLQQKMSTMNLMDDKQSKTYVQRQLKKKIQMSKIQEESVESRVRHLWSRLSNLMDTSETSPIHNKPNTDKVVIHGDNKVQHSLNHQNVTDKPYKYQLRNTNHYKQHHQHKKHSKISLPIDQKKKRLHKHINDLYTTNHYHYPNIHNHTYYNLTLTQSNHCYMYPRCLLYNCCNDTFTHHVNYYFAKQQEMIVYMKKINLLNNHLKNESKMSTTSISSSSSSLHTMNESDSMITSSSIMNIHVPMMTNWFDSNDNDDHHLSPILQTQTSVRILEMKSIKEHGNLHQNVKKDDFISYLPPKYDTVVSTIPTSELDNNIKRRKKNHSNIGNNSNTKSDNHINDNNNNDMKRKFSVRYINKCLYDTSCNTSIPFHTRMNTHPWIQHTLTIDDITSQLIHLPPTSPYMYEQLHNRSEFRILYLVQGTHRKLLPPWYERMTDMIFLSYTQPPSPPPSPLSPLSPLSADTVNNTAILRNNTNPITTTDRYSSNTYDRDTSTTTTNTTRDASYYDLYYPNASFAMGRNALYTAARILELQQGWLYNYYIFVDDDVILSKKHNTQISPYLFEIDLLLWQPAIGGPNFNMKYPSFHSEIEAIGHMDYIYIAYHREVIEILFPLIIEDESTCALSPQLMQLYEASLIYRNHILAFNSLHVTNQHHRSYPKNCNSVTGFPKVLGNFLTDISTSQFHCSHSNVKDYELSGLSIQNFPQGLKMGHVRPKMTKYYLINYELDEYTYTPSMSCIQHGWDPTTSECCTLDTYNMNSDEKSTSKNTVNPNNSINTTSESLHDNTIITSLSSSSSLSFISIILPLDPMTNDITNSNSPNKSIVWYYWMMQNDTIGHYLSSSHMISILSNINLDQISDVNTTHQRVSSVSTSHNDSNSNNDSNDDSNDISSPKPNSLMEHNINDSTLIHNRHLVDSDNSHVTVTLKDHPFDSWKNLITRTYYLNNEIDREALKHLRLYQDGYLQNIDILLHDIQYSSNNENNSHVGNKVIHKYIGFPPNTILKLEDNDIYYIMNDNYTLNQITNQSHPEMIFALERLQKEQEKRDKEGYEIYDMDIEFHELIHSNKPYYNIDREHLNLLLSQ